MAPSANSRAQPVVADLVTDTGADAAAGGELAVTEGAARLGDAQEGRAQAALGHQRVDAGLVEQVGRSGFGRSAAAGEERLARPVPRPELLRVGYQPSEAVPIHQVSDAGPGSAVGATIGTAVGAAVSAAVRATVRATIRTAVSAAVGATVRATVRATVGTTGLGAAVRRAVLVVRAAVEGSVGALGLVLAHASSTSSWAPGGRPLGPARSRLSPCWPAGPDPASRGLDARAAAPTTTMSPVDLLETLRGAPAASTGALTRWRWLAEVGGRDLALAKLVEPHLDATAILADLGAAAPGEDDAWAVWAAEPPGLHLVAGPTHDGWALNGRKAFCSGWEHVTHALVTATHQGTSRLLAVDVASARTAGALRPTGPAWQGVGMQRAGTATLELDRVRACAVGEPGDYTGRTRFWDGAIGVAAVWWGGARAVAGTLVDSARRRDVGEHALAHLGAVTSLLDRTWAHLELAARVVDAGGDDVPARRALAESVRAGVADAATEVVDRVGRALGPGPLALDAEHAARVADLLVFVRQHHAERDLAALGRLVADGYEVRP